VTESFGDTVAQEFLVVMKVDKSSHIKHPQVDARFTVNDPLSQIFADSTSCCGSRAVHTSRYEVVGHLTEQQIHHI